MAEDIASPLARLIRGRKVSPENYRTNKRTKRYRSIDEIMNVAKRVEIQVEEVTEDDYDGGGGEIEGQPDCQRCGSGDIADELLLCDRCDKGFHMLCLRPVVTRIPIGPWFCPDCSDGKNRTLKSCKSFTQKKIVDFFRIQKGIQFTGKHASSQDVKKRRKRSSSLVFPKRRRRLLPYIPSENPDRRLAQMKSLAFALTAHGMKFSNELNYKPGMAPESANQASLENGGMQVLCKEDTETLNHCRAMSKLGLFPPLVVAFDSYEGYTVEADTPIKDLTLLAEYAGDVDYIKNREEDDCDSMMTLLLSSDPSQSLVVCADKVGNVARFISGINNHTVDGRKKQNVKCVRYRVDEECVALLVATRDIAKGERLYYDYNGHEYEYPTHYFV